MAELDEVPVEPDRKYLCRHCGDFLLSTDVPLGTPGVLHMRCPSRRCRKPAHIRIGEPPTIPRQLHDDMLARRTGKVPERTDSPAYRVLA